MATHFFVAGMNVDLPLLGNRDIEFYRGRGRKSRSTVLIGRNGSGKSSILRELVMSLRSYFSPRELRSRQGLGRLSSIDVVNDGLDIRLDVRASAQSFRSARRLVRERIGGPTRVIALAFTPFDKFPPVDDLRKATGTDGEEDPFYVYLGFKGDFRASPRTRLLRSIKRLVDADPADGTASRAAHVLASIGYGPEI